MEKNKRPIFGFVIIVIFFVSSVCFAENFNALPQFKNSDRILILAPHPDDEVIGAAGVIQRALKAGAKVKVVCYTNGDNNELAFIVYEKRLTFKKKEFLHMGEVRRNETIAAMASLGLKKENIVSLGYPDFGTMEILTKYWGETKPFRSMFARVTKVSYPEAMSVSAPYVGESILKDIKTVILDFKPTKVFVSHPADANRDHSSLYLFLRIALWDIGGKIKQPEIFPYLIHVVGWPKPRGYRADLELNPPKTLSNGEISWQKLELTDEEISLKKDAVSFYKSQNKSAPSYLATFARKNELFGDFPVIQLKGQKQRLKEIDWQNPKDESKDIEESSREKEKSREDLIFGLTYALKDNNLFVRIVLKRRIAKGLGISLYLLGYSKNTDFAKMPKIQLTINILGLHMKEKKLTLPVKDIEMVNKGKAVILRIPLSILGNPDRLLSCARARSGGLPLDETAWRVLILE